MSDYDLSSLRQRGRDDKDDDNQKYESFNISKELNKIREKLQDKKNKKRFGY